jgi:uncharacterized protein (DUF983 family)
MTAPTVVPTSKQRLLRAMTLRCPECGGRGLFRHWIQMELRCGRCALKLDRGAPGHFVGAYLVNLIIAEVLFAGGMLVWLLSVWPTVNWDLVKYVSVAAMLIAPLVLYPFTRTVWLAVDLMIDPIRASDR